MVESISFQYTLQSAMSCLPFNVGFDEASMIIQVGCRLSSTSELARVYYYQLIDFIIGHSPCTLPPVRGCSQLMFVFFAFWHAPVAGGSAHFHFAQDREAYTLHHCK